MLNICNLKTIRITLWIQEFVKGFIYHYIITIISHIGDIGHLRRAAFSGKAFLVDICHHFEFYSVLSGSTPCTSEVGCSNP